MDQDSNLYYNVHEAPEAGDRVEHNVDGDTGKVESVEPDPTEIGQARGRKLVKVAWHSGYSDHHFADELIKLKVG